MKTAFTLLVAGWLCSVAGAAEVRLQVNDHAGKPVGNAVVWLKPATGQAPPPPGKLSHAVIDQQARTFTPLVSVIRVGTAVDFPNSDNIRHSVYSFSPARVFTLKLYSGKPSDPVVFDKEGFVTLGCNIHDQMIAWVVIVDTPWYAQSGAGGAALLPGVPEGDYVLSAWHPGIKGNAPITQKLHVDAGQVARTVQLDAQSIDSLLPDTEGQIRGTKEN
jgi:plastocyanin